MKLLAEIPGQHRIREASSFNLDESQGKDIDLGTVYPGVLDEEHKVIVMQVTLSKNSKKRLELGIVGAPLACGTFVL